MSKPITDTLRLIASGQLVEEATEKMTELISAIDANGGSGKITLTITVKKATRAGAMLVTGKCDVTKPKMDVLESMLWATPEGNLVTEDPHQAKLDLRTVPPSGVTSTETLKTA
jgi:hypothetical protein